MKFFKIKSNFAIILVAVTILLIFLHYLGVLSPFENIVIRILSPVQVRLFSFGTDVNQTYADKPTAEEMQIENQTLRKKVEMLTMENAQLKILEDENKNLKEQLNLVEAYQRRYISCRVVTRQFDDNSNVLILNCGLNQGIKLGLPAIVGEGVMVGKITEVKPNLSSLLLISSKTSKVGATILNEEKTSGIITGGKDMSLKMEFVPANLEIYVGDIVVTSALDEKIPSDLIIGTIDAVEHQANSFFQVADIQPIFNFENINIVSIILPPQL